MLQKKPRKPGAPERNRTAQLGLVLARPEVRRRVGDLAFERQRRDLAVDVQPSDLEVAHVAAEEPAPTRNLDRRRIDLHAVDADLVVKVRSRRHAGCTAVRDDLSLPDMRAWMDARGKARKMAVGCRIAVAVVEQDEIAEPVLHRSRWIVAGARRVRRGA